MPLETALLSAAGGNYYLILLSVIVLGFGYLFQWALRTIVADNKQDRIETLEVLKDISAAVNANCQTGTTTSQTCNRIETKLDALGRGDVR